MVNLAETIESINKAHLEWKTIKRAGEIDEENLSLMDSAGLPSYSEMQSIDDYENISVVIHEDAKRFTEITAVVYGNESYRLDVYDRDAILCVYLDDDSTSLKLTADTLEKAEKEAEDYILEGITVMLACAQKTAERYVGGNKNGKQ